MNPITEKVVNKRLNNLELNLHIINPNIMSNIDKKVVQGQIQSFKSDKVIDAMGDNSTPQAAAIFQFQMNVESFDNLDKQIEDYVKENLNKIVSV